MGRVRAVAASILCFLAAVIFLALVTVLPSRLAFRGGEQYRFYVGDTSKNCREITATRAEAPVVRILLKDVCGESALYESLDLPSFFESVNARVLFLEELSDSVNYYCAADLPYSVTLYGERVNLHVCVKESGVIAASPIIFGGY